MREGTAKTRRPFDREPQQTARRAPGLLLDLPQRRPVASAPDERVAPSRPANRELHPLIYKAIGGLTLCFILSIWRLADDARVDYLLAIVSGFLGLVVTLTWLARRVWSDSYPGATPARSETFADWAAREFETGSGLVTGGEAALQILTPIAAVTLGMVALVVVTTLAGVA